MISEKEVLESLDRLGEKLLLLREENDKQKLEIERLENENKGVSDIENKLKEELKEAKIKYGKALSVIRYVVENTIEGKYEPLIEKLENENRALGERCIQLQKDKGDLVDKVREMKADTERLKASVDAKDKSLEAINNRLKSFSKESSELDIDSMITRIHNNDVKDSEVDAKLKEIRNERFTIQYEWGRATKETEKKFVDFVKRLWEDFAVIGNYKVLNKIADVKGDLDDNTLNTFIRFLLDKKLIERRDNGETVSTADLEKVVEVITKVC